MVEGKARITREIGLWLVRLRVQTRMSVNEVAMASGCDVLLVEAWEKGYPIPVADFMAMMEVLGVGGEVMSAKLTHLRTKHLSGR